jgi:hypothetical protein
MWSGGVFELKMGVRGGKCNTLQPNATLFSVYLAIK